MPPVTGPTSTIIDPDKLSRLNAPDVQDVVRRGNIDEILKVTGISKKDWEDYLKSQSVSLGRDIVQDYQIYSDFGSVPAPQFTEGFSPELGVGKVTPQDHATFMESIGRLSGKASVAGGKSSMSGKFQEAPADLAAAVEGYVQQTDDVIQGIADNVLDTQLNLQVEAGSRETQKARDEFLRILSTANNPETIILALTQYKMREAGEIMTKAGVDVQRTSREQSRAAAATQKLNVNDPKFYAQSQQASQKVSSLNMTMQQKMSLMQTAAQNVESALSFGKSVISEIAKTKDAMLRNQAK